MKKFIAIIAVLMTLVFCLPLSAFASDVTTEDTTADTQPETVTEPLQETAAETTAVGLEPEDEYCHCATKPTSKFCPECGKLHPDYESFWFCKGCGEVVPPSNFCAVCGTANQSGEDVKTEFGFFPASLAETLPIMGMGMLGIFLVIGVIVLVVVVLGAISKKLDQDEE